MRIFKVTIWLVIKSTTLLAQMDFTASTSGAPGATWLRSDCFAHVSSTSGKSLFWNSTVIGYSPDERTDIVVGSSAYSAAEGKDSYGAVVGLKRIVSRKPGFASSLGGLFLQPQAGGQKDNFGLVFALADYTLRRFNNITLTGGLHSVVGRSSVAGWTRHGTILGASVPLRQSSSNEGWQMSIDVSWVSGYHFFSYHTYDLTLRKERVAVVMGYSASNRPTANHGPFLSLQYKLK